ncbi:hypothetical protein PIIN_04802 [Serendipita indica DSM 11827]|uniref:Uncharacterized protein n=1 Tax=Serendipita indica (strain DSM 11827) TaxID=1109443 RepID=G4THS1_SERID|nr:hypothetical protein PIIN_04802 [Serendipita indica DSM 11827]
MQKLPYELIREILFLSNQLLRQLEPHNKFFHGLHAHVTGYVSANLTAIEISTRSRHKDDDLSTGWLTRLKHLAIFSRGISMSTPLLQSTIDANPHLETLIISVSGVEMSSPLYTPTLKRLEINAGELIDLTLIVKDDTHVFLTGGVPSRVRTGLAMVYFRLFLDVRYLVTVI